MPSGAEVMMDSSADDPLREATDVEQRFYSEGFQDGFTHGQLHGLFEGRELGKEKAFDLWEEVGYYEGTAMFWMESLQGSQGTGTAGGKSKETRALNHARNLYDLIQELPTTNPSPRLSQELPSDTQSAAQPGEIDLPALLSGIRAKYKLLCASLGIRPRLVAGSATRQRSEDGTDDQDEAKGTAVEGIEGPMKGVDTTKLRF